MHIAVDLDGTIDAAPTLFQNMLAALKAAGHTISVVTGSTMIDDDAVRQKQNYLISLGLGESYSQLVVLPDKEATGGTSLADSKAAWCKQNGVDVLIDNKKANAKAAGDAGIVLCLVPWATRV